MQHGEDRLKNPVRWPPETAGCVLESNCASESPPSTPDATSAGQGACICCSPCSKTTSRDLLPNRLELLYGHCKIHLLQLEQVRLALPSHNALWLAHPQRFSSYAQPRPLLTSWRRHLNVLWTSGASARGGLACVCLELMACAEIPGIKTKNCLKDSKVTVLYSKASTEKAQLAGPCKQGPGSLQGLARATLTARWFQWVHNLEHVGLSS